MTQPPDLTLSSLDQFEPSTQGSPGLRVHNRSSGSVVGVYGDADTLRSFAVALLLSIEQFDL